MNIGDRLKLLRESLSDGDKKMSMAAFGSSLDVSAATINQWEKGKREIPKPLITLICQKYDASETWLRTGEGDMFKPRTRNEEIAGLINDILSDKPESFRRRFIEAVVHLDQEDWDAAADLFKKIKDRMDV